MGKIIGIVIWAIIAACCGCVSKKKTAATKPPQIEELGGISVAKNPKAIQFRAAEPILFNIVHTSIDVTPVWQNHTIQGQVMHTIMVPHQLPNNTMQLDAKSMAIAQVQLDGIVCAHQSTASKCNIVLPSGLAYPYQGKLQIKYTAQPDAKEKGGSASISNDKGFYFINTEGTDKYKPTQAWTQGETEANSCWFPTVDKPNYKSKFTVRVTVPAKYCTVSNGTLTVQKANTDGTRTDTWEQTKPMSAYLVMLAIGDYAIVDAPPYKIDFLQNAQRTDSLPIKYYVEPQYKNNATKIFENTPEMINFFSNKLGYPFAWSKYTQITARDYVSGAMENTSASLFGEFVQVDERGSLDQSNEGIVAHELFHQWFGDVVTCESWSHLTMNEGFASYGEYLWQEYKYGKQSAERNIYGDIKRYLRFSEEKDHALINFYYKDKEDMFNPISYRKGARVLHLLRYELGDSIFFLGLSKFLRQYEMKAVEADHLRLTMEEVSGRDLRLFWNQWYYSGGHPNIHFVYNTDTSVEGNLQLNIAYKQFSDSSRVYRFPMAFTIKGNLGEKYQRVDISSKSGTIKIDLQGVTNDRHSVNIYPDDDHVFIGKITEELTTEQYVQKYVHTQSYMHKRLILDTLLRTKDTVAIAQCLALALRDADKYMRNEALDNVDLKLAIHQVLIPVVERIADSDSFLASKANALRKLGQIKNKKYQQLFASNCNAQSYDVAASALVALKQIDAAAAQEICHRDKYVYNKLTPTHVEVLATEGVDTCIAYYTEAAAHMFGGARIKVLNNLAYLVQVSQNTNAEKALIECLIFYATKDEDDNVRANAVKGLQTILKFYAASTTQKTGRMANIAMIRAALPAAK